MRNTRRKSTVFTLTLGIALCAFAGVDALLPWPQKVEPDEGFFVAKEDAASVHIKETADASLPKEGYRLTVAPDGITVKSADAAGAFYARQTLRQLAEKEKDGWRYPCVKIEDWPAYAWRGVLLDEGRHFFGKETVLQLLDLMSRYKLNVFNWHLTEDQGWRLDVPAYPKLAQCGSMRLRSPAHGSWLKCNRKEFIYESSKMTTEKYGPFFYTADDVKEVLAYAKARHIQVVPEIELPGHARGALGAYPEFACFPERIPAGSAADDWGIFRDVFCIGNDRTVKFLEDVMDYVCELFPDSPVIHIGGDECPRVNWEECPKCQARMKAEGLEKAGDLQAWITRRIAARMAKKGRRIIGWDEILSGDVPKSAIGLSWRMAKGEGAGTEHVSGADGAVKGYDMVMTPHRLCYYNYLQGVAEDPFKRGGPPLTLEKAYSFDPLEGVPEAARVHILGGQCCLWGEYIWNMYDLAWRMWPRAFAMSEVLWTAPKARDFGAFERRAAVERSRLIKMGVNCAPLK